MPCCFWERPLSHSCMPTKKTTKEEDTIPKKHVVGFLHMEKREWKEAEDTFKELRSDAKNKNDAYACLAQGAIPLNSLSGRRKVRSS